MAVRMRRSEAELHKVTSNETKEAMHKPWCRCYVCLHYGKSDDPRALMERYEHYYKENGKTSLG